MNTEQLNFLHRHGAESVADLPVLRRLEFTEIDPTPDPVEMNQAQRDWLLGDSPDDLDDDQRAVFNRLGPYQAAPRGADTATGSATGGPPKLDVQKLGNANLSASRRLEIAYHFDTLSKAYRESAAGIPEHLRETRFDIEAAKHHTAEYLA